MHAFIIGEHGDSELAVWSSANISGVDLSEFCSAGGMKLTAEELDTLYREVRDSAYEIIDKKGGHILWHRHERAADLRKHRPGRTQHFAGEFADHRALWPDGYLHGAFPPFWAGKAWNGCWISR